MFWRAGQGCPAGAVDGRIVCFWISVHALGWVSRGSNNALSINSLSIYILGYILAY